MSETSHRQQVAAIAGEWRIDVPAKSAQYLRRRWLLRSCHLLNHQRREHTAATKQKLGELRKIVGGREYPRVSGHSTHPARGRVVNDSAQHMVLFVKLGGSDLH